MPPGEFWNFIASVRGTIIRNDSPWHAKEIYDIVLEELNDCFHCYFPKGYCLSPLREMISGSKNKPVPGRWWWINWAHYVCTPQLKRPWGHGWIQRVRMYMDKVIMYLAHVTTFRIINAIACHNWPEITHPLNLPFHLWTRLMRSRDARVHFI